MQERIAGVDEAGRGPLAGPVYAAAVILDPRIDIPGIDDSKRLSPARREAVEKNIRRHALAFALARVEACDIDRINILQATMEAMRKALLSLEPLPHRALIDGNRCPPLPFPAQAVIGGDRRVASIGAASIIAKVARDRAMVDLDRLYPRYGFARHKGYGTRVHLKALQAYGPTPEHRRSFAPVRLMKAREALG